MKRVEQVSSFIAHERDGTRHEVLMLRTIEGIVNAKGESHEVCESVGLRTLNGSSVTMIEVGYYQLHDARRGTIELTSSDPNAPQVVV